MDHPTLLPARRVGPDTDLFSTHVPLPGLGVLPINAYLIHAREPVLVDTGIGALRDDFLRALAARIDPAELRWIWLTHADADHVGALRAVLEAAPRARIVTNFLGVGKLGLLQLPLDRTWLINPGQALAVGDRRLLARRPPVYDAPETMAVFDERTGHLFSSDCFGAVLAQPASVAEEVAPAALHEGLALWAGIDAPWLAQLGRDAFAAACRPLRDLRPQRVLGSHLPPAAGLEEALYAGLEAARGRAPFVGPDQAAFEQAMRAAEPALA
jgi:glyoxylase-like metal-dependent hydrolase (beta-lactamase superfamily II)